PSTCPRRRPRPSSTKRSPERGVVSPLGIAAMSTWTIVLAAGAGRRFDPVRRKQYELIGTRRVVDLSLEHARSVSDGVVVVVGHEFVPEPDAPADFVVMGGERRSDSVRCGLDVIPDDCD